MGASNYVHVEVDEVLKETEAAFLVLIDDDQHWLPKSQIADANDYAVGDTNLTMSISEWLARQKGLGE